MVGISLKRLQMNIPLQSIFLRPGGNWSCQVNLSQLTNEMVGGHPVPRRLVVYLAVSMRFRSKSHLASQENDLFNEFI